jgi:hypothetical protein
MRHCGTLSKVNAMGGVVDTGVVPPDLPGIYRIHTPCGIFRFKIYRYYTGIQYTGII